MTERRVDPFTGRGVWIAPGRRGLGATRPGGLPTPSGRCPFCPGHEADTEVTIARWPATGRWRCRVVGNKYPLLTETHGRHEVGIDSPEHDADLDRMDTDEVAAALGLYRDRVRALEARDDISAVLVFRNRGRRAGSSQPHPHTQIAALTTVPVDFELRWRRARAFLEAHGEPLHLAENRRELQGPRLLEEGPRVLAFCPWAPSRAWQVRLAPRAPEGGFATATTAELHATAALLRRYVGRLKERFGVRDYNLLVRTPPANTEGPARSWHLDVLPRTGGDAGYELGSGESIVVVTPEEAAADLR